MAGMTHDGEDAAGGGARTTVEGGARAATSGGSGSVTGDRESRRRRPRRFRLPLSVVVARYFLYLLVGAAFVVGIPGLTFSLLMSGGSVLPANYAEVHIQEVEDELSGQRAFDFAALPSAYYYAHLSADGSTVLESDMSSDMLEQARALASTPDAHTGTDFMPYVTVSLSDGTQCVLSYRLVPQWSDRGLRDAWLNPQDLLIFSIVVPLVCLIALVALRASHVLTRKMSPLVKAADAVAAQDLEFTVGSSNVAQIDDVLVAMDRMRDSLKESLEARWRAEATQRAQMAALAHDLGTPLTVIRANADYLAEEELRPDARAAAQAIVDGARRLDDYSRLIMDVSREGDAAFRFEKVDLSHWVDVIRHETSRLAEATGTHLDIEGTPAFVALGDSAYLEADEVATVRAAINVVKNAIEHSPEGGAVRLRFDCSEDSFSLSVSDEGAGFSAQALAHGAERFFRDDASRSGEAREGHYGLGLAIAADILRVHGGRLELSNHQGGGAQVRLVFPLTFRRSGPA